MHTSTRRTALLVGLLGWLFAPSIADAQYDCANLDGAQRTSRLALWGSSAGVAAGLGAGAWLWLPQQRNRPWDLEMDGAADGTRRRTAEVASHLTLAASGAFALGASLRNAVRCGRRTGSAVAALLSISRGAHALLWTATATEWTKRLAGRPRPYLALRRESLGQRDHRSFLSGHAALAASGAAHGVLELLRDTALSPRLQLSTGVLVGTAWGAFTGWLRVRDGVHYWSDVLAGLASGVLITLTPALPARVSRRMSVGLGNGLQVRWVL